MRITPVQGGCRISGGVTTALNTYTWLILKNGDHFKCLFLYRDSREEALGEYYMRKYAKSSGGEQ